MARGAEDAAMQHGYRLMFGNSDESLVKEKDYVQMILSMRVDGVLFAPSGDQSKEHLEWLTRQNVPFVLLDREVPGIDCDAVLGDSRGGAKQMVSELIRYGHRRIALLNGSEEVSTARERKAGYIAALQKAGIPFDEQLCMQMGYLHDRDALDLSHWTELEPQSRPTAIFAANNMLALSIFTALNNVGLRVPDDISIACFDDFGWVEEANPFFSVASQPAYQFGETGIQLLLERIKDRDQASRRIILPCQVHMRQSVRQL